jgi:hypothetical protein
MNPNALLVAVLVVPLPFIASGNPNVGGFIYRRENRLPILGVCLALAVGGLLAVLAQMIPLKIGLYFFAPLWQIIVIQMGYYIWFKFNKRPPVNVNFNWKPGLFWDRIFSIITGLLGVLVPVWVIGR